MQTILYPMCAMAIMTLLVLPFTLINRVKAIKRKEVSTKAFELSEVDQFPKKLQQHTKHISNLFEVPTLFYAACLTILTLEIGDNIFVIQGWIYFLLRAAHSFIHLSYNKVPHRASVFALSNITLVTIWVRIILNS